MEPVFYWTGLLAWALAGLIGLMLLLWDVVNWWFRRTGQLGLLAEFLVWKKRGGGDPTTPPTTSEEE